MRITAFAAAALVTAFAASLPATAADIDVTIRFSSKEISLMQAFYRSHREHGKGGKKTARPLPPGIAKNLAMGKPLPPGIAKQSLPGALVTQLPPVAHGYERVVVAGKILLVEIATQIVHDILTDVILD